MTCLSTRSHNIPEIMAAARRTQRSDGSLFVLFCFVLFFLAVRKSAVPRKMRVAMAENSTAVGHLPTTVLCNILLRANHQSNTRNLCSSFAPIKAVLPATRDQLFPSPNVSQCSREFKTHRFLGFFQGAFTNPRRL